MAAGFSSKWLAASILLAVFSLGLSGILKLLTSILLIICGCLVVLYAVTSSDRGVAFGLNVLNARQQWQRQQRAPQALRGRPSMSSQLTGIHMMDDQLHLIISYLMRDYVHSWQGQLTHTNDLPQHAQQTLQHVVSSLADKFARVDWIPFLTTRLVDDIASHVRLYKRARLMQKTKLASSDNSKTSFDLESLFFDAEVAMEEGQVCRDLVCTIHQDEINYLQDVSDLLLFLLLPKEEFKAQATRTLVRELLVNIVLKPLLDLISDPDWINQNVVWLYKDVAIKPDLFTMALRYSERLEELQATRESVSKQINFLRSNDSKAALDSSLKLQLNALLQLRKTIDSRIHRLQSGSETDSIGLPAQVDWNQMIGPGLKLFVLPLDVVLKNNLALSYFIDYMSSIGSQNYIFFYLNIEGWRVSADQQLQALDFDENAEVSGASVAIESPDFKKKASAISNETKRATVMENLREAAYSIYEEYISEKASPRLKLDDSIVKRLLFKIRTEPPDPEWFSEVQTAVFDKLQNEERFLEAFKRSMGYVKLLAELDLLKDTASSTKSEEEEDEASIYDTLSLNSLEGSRGSLDEITRHECEEEESKGDDRKDKLSVLDADTTLTPENSGDNGLTVKRHRRVGSDSYHPFRRTHRRNASQGSLGGGDPLGHLPPILSAEVNGCKTVREAPGKSYAVYRILVRSRDARGQGEEERAIFRRYSDFYALHDQVSTAFHDLSKLAFPGKRAFGNLGSQVLQKRLAMLHSYLQELLKTEVLEQHPGLLELLRKFLDQHSYEKERQQSSHMAKAVGTVKNSVKTVSHAVTSMPGTLIQRVDSVVDGLSRVLQQTRGDPQAAAAFLDTKVGASLENDRDQDNIPLRITLLLMDEVFDLRERNQWLRRQIVFVLRQIIKAMLGDIVNRRIVEYFAHLTSPAMLGALAKSVRESLWPGGFPAETAPPRDEATKMRTRVAAKMALFSSLPDELRRIIGSETSRAGLLVVFDMLQRPVLNKRLSVVMLEGILDTLFPGRDFKDIFVKLHSRSSRVRNELRNSQRKHEDLRR